MLENLYNFIAMGGHGLYIWSAYAVTFAGLFVLWVVIHRNKLRALQRIVHVSKDTKHARYNATEKH